MACEVNNKEINSQCAELLVRPTYLNYFRNYNRSKYRKFLNKTSRILIFFQVDSFTSIFDIDVKDLEIQTL